MDHVFFKEINFRVDVSDKLIYRDMLDTNLFVDVSCVIKDSYNRKLLGTPYCQLITDYETNGKKYYNVFIQAYEDQIMKLFDFRIIEIDRKRLVLDDIEGSIENGVYIELTHYYKRVFRWNKKKRR